MEKSLINLNRKRAILVSNPNLCISTIENILDEENYYIHNYPLNESDTCPLKSRLVVYISTNVDDRLVRFVERKNVANRAIPLLLILTGEGREVSKAIYKMNINGVVNVNDSIGELKKAIIELEKDGSYVSAYYKREDFDREKKLDLMTRRQYQIYTLKQDGNSIEQIAKTLDITEKTVRNHLSKIRAILE